MMEIGDNTCKLLELVQCLQPMHVEMLLEMKTSKGIKWVQQAVRVCS